jgi:hypothetical protein
MYAVINGEREELGWNNSTESQPMLPGCMGSHAYVTFALRCAECSEALATYPDRAVLKREHPELEDEDIRQALAFAAAWWMTRSCPCPSGLIS